jgi:hypothetical protein
MGPKHDKIKTVTLKKKRESNPTKTGKKKYIKTGGTQVQLK